MANAKIDGNYKGTLIGVSSDDLVTPTLVAVDPVTNRLLVNSTATIDTTGLALAANQLANNHNVVVTSTPTTAVTGTFFQATQPISAVSLPLPTSASTSDNQQPPSTTPAVYNITLTNANTEYSQALPDNTRELRFTCRTAFDLRFSWSTGKVATPTAPYLTLKAGEQYFSDYNNLSSITLYVASATAGVILEIEVYT